MLLNMVINIQQNIADWFLIKQIFLLYVLCLSFFPLIAIYKKKFTVIRCTSDFDAFDVQESQEWS